MTAKRPNILHIIPHDLGRRLGCYGHDDVASPNLDRLAGESVRFQNCFTASPPCSPARGCLMTGRYAHCNGEVGLVNRGFDLPEGERTIVDHLSDAGYFTANIGLQHERSDPRQNHYQYDDHESNDCEVVAEKVAAFLSDRGGAPGRPFYLNAGFFEVHLPFDRPEYEADDPARVIVPPYLPDNRWVREELGRFHGSIRFMDQAVGRILGSLAGAGLDDDTLVMFTTDHGMAFPRAKSTLYDPGIEIALIMRPPGGIGGRVARQLISSVDIAPTLLEVAGVSPPAGIQGRSFLPLLEGESWEPHEAVFSEKNYHDTYDPVRCVRTERYKYIRSFELRPNLILPADIRRSRASNEMWPWADEPRPAEELYDLSADPWEMENLADRAEYADVCSELRDRLARWMEETEDPLLSGPIPAPPGADLDPAPVPGQAG